MRIDRLPQSQVDIAWPHIEPLIRKGYERTGLEPEYSELGLYTEIMEGQKQAWVVHDEDLMGVYVTSIYTKHHNKILKVVAVGGERIDEWLSDAIASLGELRREHDCDVIRCAGREGWKRLLKPFRPVNVRYEFDLEV